jgi:hypothetical protein
MFFSSPYKVLMRLSIITLLSEIVITQEGVVQSSILITRNAYKIYFMNKYLLHFGINTSRGLFFLPLMRVIFRDNPLMRPHCQTAASQIVPLQHAAG